MRFSKSDFPLMGWNILAICASLLISTLVLYGSREHAEKTNKDRLDAQSRINDARNRLAAAQDDQKNMTIYAGEYGVLIKRNIIGDDHRLDWIEALEKIRQQNLAANFRYSIAPQKIYTPQPAIDSGSFEIHYSEMKLQFNLLHEGQLLDFFTALRSQVNGQYQLEGCTLRRPNDEGDADGTTGHFTRRPEDGSQVAGYATAVATRLKAECSGGWVTLKNRIAPE